MLFKVSGKYREPEFYYFVKSLVKYINRRIINKKYDFIPDISADICNIIGGYFCYINREYELYPYFDCERVLYHYRLLSGIGVVTFTF